MTKSKGFSLIEILVSLLLMTGVALVLLQQQFQLGQAVNQLLKDSLAQMELDNQKEISG